MKRNEPEWMPELVEVHRLARGVSYRHMRDRPITFQEALDLIQREHERDIRMDEMGVWMYRIRHVLTDHTILLPTPT